VMTKRLVELMGGNIGVDSVVGSGSSFWIEMAIASGAQKFASRERLPSNHTERKAVANKHTLLYVEDNPANLMLVEDLIARRPEIRLLTANDGREGVEIARAAQPDVILMDINLPGISGIKALGLLRDDPVTAHIPIIAVSANAMPRDIKKGLDAGIFRYITKPIDVKDFMEAVDIAIAFADRQYSDIDAETYHDTN